LPSIFPYETLRRNNGYKQGFKEGFMIRITAGEWKGREIKTPPQAKAAQGLRPTLAKTRQALFNSIQFQIPDARILDLFSGSGALGLEALSRGAAHVTFVESDGDSLRCLRENTQAFKAGDRVTILAGRVEKVLRAFGETANPSDAPTPPPDLYDLILADPPYHAGWETRIFEEIPLHRLLKPGGLFVFEWLKTKDCAALPERPIEGAPGFTKTRERFYGTTGLTTFTYDPSDTPGVV
jgi:16S rRNA (guanine966-N2)-methyltransferase